MPSLRFILTIIYDSGIEKIDYIHGSKKGTCPISGESIYISCEPDSDLYLDVALKNGYSIDTVTLGTVAGNRITIAAENISPNATLDCTITTKQSTPQPSLTFKHFYDAGTIGTGTYKFRHYSQEKPSTGETWVLNENAYDPINNFTYTADFVCDNVNYTKIVNSNNPMSGGLFYDTTKVVNPDNAAKFISETYRTITFATAPTGDLLTWLQANGTKQGGGGGDSNT